MGGAKQPPSHCAEVLKHIPIQGCVAEGLQRRLVSLGWIGAQLVASHPWLSHRYAAIGGGVGAFSCGAAASSPCWLPLSCARRAACVYGSGLEGVKHRSCCAVSTSIGYALHSVSGSMGLPM